MNLTADWSRRHYVEAPLVFRGRQWIRDFRYRYSQVRIFYVLVKKHKTNTNQKKRKL